MDYTVAMKVMGLDWDDGNWPKCAKHGFTKEEIAEVLLGDTLTVIPDPYPHESRLRGIGQTKSGRHVFIVFTIRQTEIGHKIRPISARYMHKKEVDHYAALQKNTKI